MHPADEDFFRRFAAVARVLGRSLDEHYARSQREQRDSEGGASVLLAHEQRGLALAAGALSPQDSVLVVGCGAGAELAFLRQLGFFRLTGLDISPRLAAAARARLGVPVIVADMMRSGLAERSFDAVLVHRALHHLLYPFAGLEEIARLARAKVLIVDEPARSAIKRAVARLLGRPLIGSAGAYEYQFATDDVARYMAFNGFACTLMRRYWETRWPAINSVGNVFAAPAGNRFAAIFQRLKVVSS